MAKSKEQVIEEFNELVNMSADELEEWLKSEQSTQSGWQKNATSSTWTDNDGTGETIGHESGRRIVDILRGNPKRDPEDYDDEDIAHMRRVVSYCKRHLAQEQTAKLDPNSKSYKSLKNWGHDALKA